MLQLERVLKYIELGKKEGAKLECGGKQIMNLPGTDKREGSLC